MEEIHNVKDPIQFKKSLDNIVNGMNDLFESTFEKKYPKETNGIVHIVGRKSCFQVSNQYRRSHEFLQAFLDMLHVIYEPQPIGTLLFNSNPSFLLEAIPAEPFQLGYGSFVSKPQHSFKEFWSESICRSLEDYGYNLEEATGLFIAVSTGKERYENILDIVEEVCEILDAGFSSEEAFGLITSGMNEDLTKPQKRAYAGYCLVPELDERLRVSLWMFNR